MKKYFTIILAVGIMLAGIQVSAFAEKGYRHKGKSFKDSFFKKVGIIYQNKEELNITDEQLSKLKDIKMALKKDLIMKEAEVEVVDLDIESLMYENSPDIETIDSLVDKKYDLKREKTKKIISSCVALKDILSDKQVDQIKSIMKEKTKECPMMKDNREMMGSMMMRRK